ncbi:hypothetical protein [Mesonia sp. K7]|uniref:hypothetical protein n=1 Tax=Mesonia sp. K7 TaxID=2218606 RepID=UPI000DA72BC9|nr:hypothetical protein [Mesonia sp. K7]PZD79319.1 hypothetical protein DNG35_02200 [Mesonia sp. K7]
MKDQRAQKLIKKIIDDLEHAGIITNTLVKDLKALRPFAVEENQPVVAKALRLAYEHIEENYTFDIAIPEDEPLDEADVITETKINADESMLYFMDLIKNSDNTLNIEELREYNLALQEYEF